MRRFLMISGLLAGLSAPAFAQNPAAPAAPAPAVPSLTPSTERTPLRDFMFRGFVMGVGKEDVLKYEKLAFYKEEGNKLFYLSKPDYFRRLFEYDFRSNKLWRIQYSYVEYTYPNAQSIVNDYYAEYAALKQAYGEPALEAPQWKNKKYYDYPEFWGRALLSKDLRFYTEWRFKGNVRLVLECYFDGMFYQLYYTFEKMENAPQTSGGILNLPGAPAAPQKMKP